MHLVKKKDSIQEDTCLQLLASRPPEDQRQAKVQGIKQDGARDSTQILGFDIPEAAGR